MQNKEIELILASGSPRRQDFLRDLGLTFTTKPADIDETPLKGEKPKDYVQRISYEKASCVAENNINSVVLAADTTVCVGRNILGKPQNSKEAAQMLRMMSGRRHRVLTTVVAITPDGSVYENTTVTLVKVRPLSDKDIKSYIAMPSNWQGLAGGYGLQMATGGALISQINGSASGVVGLPLVETTNLLRRCGYDV